jgi:mono/diheme cytochrome c family protein
MQKLRRVYAITSVFFLAVLAISPLKDTMQEWRAVQKEYNEIIEELPQKVKPVPIGLQQIWVQDLDRIDRCTTCHVGVQNRKLANVPEPFRTHPKVGHDLDKFGCTICHQGQGLATKYDDAHLASEFWDKPVLPNRYLQSSCGRCHLGAELKETPALNRGRDLIEKLNCVACHDLPEFQKGFAPSLDGIGSKVVNRGWLVRWLKDPREFRPQTEMPNFFLTDEESDVLADFLMSFKALPDNARLEPLPEIYREKKEDDDFIELGKTRFREARCISCHAVEGRGGHLAADLAKVASKAQDIWILNYIKNPKKFQPEVEMPQYGFSDEEVAAITAYIEFEFVDWDAPEEEVTRHEAAPNFYERGMAIFNQYNCGGCHQLSEEKVVQNRGPDLSATGSKKIYQIDFGKTKIPHTLYDYIDAKLKTPREFGENVRMPRYDLADEDREAIIAYLLSLADEPLPKEYVHSTQIPPPFNPQGIVGQIVRKYSCLKCHSVRGTGETIAPDLTLVGSQLHPEWVRQYFKVPYSLRPIVEERMPNLFISDEEIETLVSYFYTELLDDNVSAKNGLQPTPQGEERGRGLFWEKYGCQSCHLVGGKGGYVGPPLDHVGDRLQPGWMLGWLLNPQEYQPDTIEPRSGMTLDEAKDIAAYLMSL